MPTRPNVYHAPHYDPQAGQWRKQSTLAYKLRGTAQYKRFREVFKQQHPLCERCLAEGVTRAGDELHHKAPVEQAPHLLCDPDNAEHLCTKHHAIESARERRGGAL